MDLAKNDDDKLPEDAIEARAKTYKTMMTVGYLALLPGVIAVVMGVTIGMLGHGWGAAFLITLLTFLGVFAFSKTFFVH